MKRRAFVKTLPAAAVLAAWFHNCEKDITVQEFNLKSHQKILFSQTVGYQG